VTTAQRTTPLSTTTSRDGDAVVLVCIGSAETETFADLTAALENAHRDAIENGVKSVVADIRGLEFASSSCLKAFVTWLQRVRDLGDGQRYKVHFRSTARYSWQRRSLGALAAFAVGVVEIESEPS
jgi:anti-anti-sigma regulatory factor